MKKKLMAVLLVLAMAATMLVGCGGSSEEAGSESSDVKATVFWYEESDVYLGTVRTALNAELEAAGIAYDNQFAGNDQAKQIDQIKTAIAGGTNRLVVNIVTSGAPDTALKRRTAVDLPQNPLQLMLSLLFLRSLEQ